MRYTPVKMTYISIGASQIQDLHLSIEEYWSSFTLSIDQKHADKAQKLQEHHQRHLAALKVRMVSL